MKNICKIIVKLLNDPDKKNKKWGFFFENRIL
jgi:hypothetical protein